MVENSAAWYNERLKRQDQMNDNDSYEDMELTDNLNLETCISIVRLLA